jgi:hypothetical protein
MLSRELSRSERLFLVAMQKLSTKMEGFSVLFADELVRQYGITGFLRWVVRMKGLWKELTTHFGERDAHLLTAFATMWNGCGYCAEGHLLAYNLVHFNETGELSPLDEKEIQPLMRKRGDEIVRLLRERLTGPRWAKTLALILRQRDLLLDPTLGGGPDDEMLRRAQAMYEWTNDCSVVADGKVAPAMGRIAKIPELRARYEAARRQATSMPIAG